MGPGFPGGPLEIFCPNRLSLLFWAKKSPPILPEGLGLEGEVKRQSYDESYRLDIHFWTQAQMDVGTVRVKFRSRKHSYPILASGGGGGIKVSSSWLSDN